MRTSWRSKNDHGIWREKPGTVAVATNSRESAVHWQLKSTLPQKLIRVHSSHPPNSLPRLILCSLFYFVSFAFTWFISLVTSTDYVPSDALINSLSLFLSVSLKPDFCQSCHLSLFLVIVCPSIFSPLCPFLFLPLSFTLLLTFYLSACDEPFSEKRHCVYVFKSINIYS